MTGVGFSYQAGSHLSRAAAWTPGDTYGKLGVVMDKGWSHFHADRCWSLASSLCPGIRQIWGLEMAERRTRTRTFVIVCSSSHGLVSSARFSQWMRGLSGLQSQAVQSYEWLCTAAVPGVSHSFSSPMSAQPWMDCFAKQVGLLSLMLCSFIPLEFTTLGLIALASALALSALRNCGWQNCLGGDRLNTLCIASFQNEHVGTVEDDTQSKLRISEMASFGALSYNCDTPIGKLGLYACGCVALVGLFSVGYSLVGTTYGQPVKRRVIRAQRHGDFRERLRRRSGGKQEMGFRVTYDESLLKSFFSASTEVSVRDKLFNEANSGAKSTPLTATDDIPFRPRTERSDGRLNAASSNRLRGLDLDKQNLLETNESLLAGSNNGSPPSNVVPASIDSEHQVIRPLSNLSGLAKERRPISRKPDNLATCVVVSPIGGNAKMNSKAYKGMALDNRKSTSAGGSTKWQVEDELELKGRIEELRRKVLSAEQNRQAAMRSLAEEKRRSLELEVKISRQKQAAAALEEEVRVLKESHEALLTSLRKKYSSSVAARAAAALLYQNWDSTGEDIVREMVY